jgi:methionine-rich copper-binding protein CopC
MQFKSSHRFVPGLVLRSLLRPLLQPLSLPLFQPFKAAFVSSSRSSSRSSSLSSSLSSPIFSRVSPWAAMVIALSLAFGFATSAAAHAHLKTADPAANAILGNAPQQLQLHYTEGLELALSSLKVTGPGGTLIDSGPLALAKDDDTALLVPLNGATAPGRYQVEWHVVAKDGHRTHGTYSFTVQP